MLLVAFMLYIYICSKVPLLGLETIYRDDKPVGFLRRGDFAFALNKSIGYGYISNPDDPDQIINKKFVEVIYSFIL